MQPEIIRTAIENDWGHVFLVNSPIVAIVARMVIEAYGIPSNNVKCVSINRADTSLVCAESINFRSWWFDRFLAKIFRYSPMGVRITAELNNDNKKYLVYAAWVYPEVESILNSPNCLGHMYLEEGQLTYYNSKPYTNTKYNSWYYRKKKKEAGSVDYYFREDAAAVFALSTQSFPSIQHNKRILLNNFNAVNKFYTPKLVGVKTIGVMPAPHRIPNEKLESALRMFLQKMPEGGAIKLHPGYCVHTVLRDQVKSCLEKLSNGSITICDDDTILELEMLAESKVFYGARSSIVRYAEEFGSIYEIINFDGYIPPNN